jgi:hypothetical protein
VSLVPASSHPLVCLGLDHNFDVDVNINVNISIDIDDLSLPALPHPQPSYHRTFDPFSSQNGSPGILPAAIPGSSSTYSHSAPEAEEALGTDEGHNTTSRPVDQSMFPLKMDARQTGECAEKGEKGNVQAGRNVICRTIFELRRS